MGSVMQSLTALQITITFLLLHVQMEAFESSICRDCETVSKACNSIILIASIYIQTEGIRDGAVDFLNFVIVACIIFPLVAFIQAGLRLYVLDAEARDLGDVREATAEASRSKEGLASGLSVVVDAVASTTAGQSEGRSSPTGGATGKKREETPEQKAERKKVSKWVDAQHFGSRDSPPIELELQERSPRLRVSTPPGGGTPKGNSAVTIPKAPPAMMVDLAPLNVTSMADMSEGVSLSLRDEEGSPRSATTITVSTAALATEVPKKKKKKKKKPGSMVTMAPAPRPSQVIKL